MDRVSSVLYTNIMSSIIKGLNDSAKMTLSMYIHKFSFIPLGLTPAIYVTGTNKHILVRLSLMILGRSFVVIPTNMDKSSTSTCLVNCNKDGIIITDNTNRLGSINENFLSERNPLLNIININNLDVESYQYTPFTGVKGVIYPDFNMKIYDLNMKLVSTNSSIFAILFFNLKRDLIANGVLLNKEADISHNWKIKANVEDFFIYYLLLISCDKLLDNPFTGITCKKHTGNLFIPYYIYKEYWDNIVETTLRNRIAFSLYFSKLFSGIILQIMMYKFKRIFKDFKNVIVLGLITDDILSKVSSSFRNIQILNTYGETQSLMAMNVSNKPGYIMDIDLKEGSNCTKIMLESNKKGISLIDISILEKSSLSFFDEKTSTLTTLISSSLFKREGKYGKYIGHSFLDGICPETIESIFNTFPFIRDSILVRNSHGSYTLLIDTREDIFDTNYISYNRWEKMFNVLLDKVNSLFDNTSFRINGFGPIPSDLKNHTRLGLLDKSNFYEMEFIR